MALVGETKKLFDRDLCKVNLNTHEMIPFMKDT